MAIKYVVYTCDDSTKVGIALEEDLLDLYPEVVRKHAQADGALGAATAPTEYADLAALQAAVPAAIAKPGALSLRGLNLSIVGFGAAFLPIMSNDTFTGDDDNGYPGQFSATLEYIVANYYVDPINETDSPFPNPIATEGVLEVNLTGYRGESRIAN